MGLPDEHDPSPEEAMAKQYWLMKSEPDVYSIEDLERDGSTCWEGVRNYKARNNMQAMKVGDEVLYYHSNARPPGVVGLARVCKEAYPDHYAFDKKQKYYDAKSDPDDPRWFMVDIEFVAKIDDPEEPLSLHEIKEDPKLSDMELVRYGRLSVQSVKKAEFDRVKKMAGL
jgi:predicted RNA-binding protein with PUA-like domain